MKYLKKQLILVIIFLTSQVYGQNTIKSELEYGDYDVGFEVIHVKDYSRNYLLKGDSIFSPRPMQIGIWYPSKKSKKIKHLDFGYYLSLEYSEETLHIINTKDVEKAKNKYTRFLQEKVEPIFNESQLAKFNSPRISGDFPLIIYASAQGYLGYENHLICEQLASQGYIVATISSKGAYSKTMPFNVEGAEAQTRDLEFLYGYMSKYPSVNIAKVGMVGYSFGGLNMVTMALRNKNIKCLVSLDGSVFSPNGESIIESYPYLKLSNLNSAFLGFLGDKTEYGSSNIYNKVNMADVYLLKLKHHNHLDFSSSNIILKNRPASIQKGYASMGNLTLGFLNKYLKSKSLFDNEVEDYSKLHYEYLEVKKSKGAPKVKKEAFVSFIKDKGIDKGIEVYHDTKKDFPEYMLFEYKSLRDVGFQKMMKKDYKNAIKVFELLMAEYPDNPDSYRRLGEAYMEDGNLEKARNHIQKGLNIQPNSPAMTDILRKINERN